MMNWTHVGQDGLSGSYQMKLRLNKTENNVFKTEVYMPTEHSLLQISCVCVRLIQFARSLNYLDEKVLKSIPSLVVKV